MTHGRMLRRTEIRGTILFLFFRGFTSLEEFLKKKKVREKKKSENAAR